MAEIGTGTPYQLDQLLDALREVALYFTVVEPNGIIHSRLPQEPLEEECTHVGVTAGGVYEVSGGDQIMHRFQTSAEANAFLAGVLMGFTGSDAHTVQSEAMTLTEVDPYQRSAELHKSGWCPIWDDWEHHFIGRR